MCLIVSQNLATTESNAPFTELEGEPSLRHLTAHNASHGGSHSLLHVQYTRSSPYIRDKAHRLFLLKRTTQRGRIHGSAVAYYWTRSTIWSV